MDKKLLNALNNLSDSLEQIVDALKSKDKNRSATSTALQGGNLTSDIKGIIDGIKSVKKDTQEILRQQKTILSMSKRSDNDKTSFFEKAGGDKKTESNLKKGVGTIILIAAAVLAIGLAFKIVGSVDFLSVISLSIAILIISKAYANVGVVVGQLSLSQIKNISLAMIFMAGAVTASSYVLSKIVVMSLPQIVTGILISGMFAVMSHKIKPLIDATLNKLNPVRLFLVMVSISAGIAASSYILSTIVPITLAQSVTGILIATMFMVMSNRIKPLIDASMNKINPIRLLLVMVSISLAITASSYILSKISDVSFRQIITGGLIAAMFAFLVPHMRPLFDAVGKSRINPFRLVLTMVAISAGITASSWVLRLITPISLAQAVTGILIAAMFAVISYNMEKLATGLSIMSRFRITKTSIVLIMGAISAGITASSWILSLITPIGFLQAITAILIAAMFAVISYHFERLAIGITIMQRFKVSKTAIFMTLVGISLAITASSWILSLVTPISLTQFLTSLGIALLFAMMSFVMPFLAIGVAIMDRTIGSRKMMAVIPLVFTALSLGIMLSSHILSLSAEMELPFLLKLTLFGIGLGLIVLAMMPSVLLVGIAAASGVGAAGIVLGALMIPIIAMAVMVSSHILAAGEYSKYPGIGWVASVGLTMIGFGLAILELGAIALTGVGALAIVAGALLIPVIAMAIVETDRIIAKGKYNKYPGLGWVASVGLTMTGFGLAVLTLGTYIVGTLGLGGIAIWAGAKAVTTVAQAIVDTDKIISKGKYDKYPGFGWVFSVGSLMTGFGLAVVTLGTYIVGTLGLGGIAIWAGAKAVSTVAQAIVDTDKIISKGKYDKYPGWQWALSVGGLMTAFGLAVVTLGTYVVGTLGLGGLAIKHGAKAVRIIAQSIVDAAWIFKGAEGAFTGGPKKEWAQGVALALGAFSPIYSMLLKGAVIKAFFGESVTTEQYKTAIITISQGIVDAAVYFRSKGDIFKGGPTKDWAEGVGKSIEAFSPVYKMLVKGGIMQLFTGKGPSITEYTDAIRTISKGIVDAAMFFGSKEANVAFSGGPKKEWAEGVGTAISAFAPVYKMLVKGGIIEVFAGKGPGIEEYKSAIISISQGIVEAAKVFADASVKFGEGNYPKKEWATGVSIAIKAFSPIFKSLSEDTGWFTSGDEVISDMVNGIVKVASAIVEVGRKFSNNSKIDWNIYPSTEWGQGVSQSIESFVSAYSSISDTDFVKSEYNVVLRAARYMSQVAKVFYRNKKFFDFNIKFDSVAFDNYMSIYNKVSMLYRPTNTYKDPMVVMATSMAKVAKELNKNSKFFTFSMKPDFMENLEYNIRAFMRIDNMVNKYYSKNIIKSMFFNPLEKLFKGIRTVVNGMSMTVPNNVIDSAFLKNAYSVISSYNKLYTYVNNHFGVMYTMKTLLKNPIVGVLKDISKVTKQIGSIGKYNIPNDLLKGIIPNLKEYTKILNLMKGKSLDSFTKNPTVMINNLVKGIKTLVGAFSKINFKMPIKSNMVSEMSRNVSNYLRIIETIAKDKTLGSLVKNVKTGDPVARMANGIVLMAKALDRMSKSISKFNKTMMSIDETKIKSFGEITKNIFTGGGNPEDILKTMSSMMNMMSGQNANVKVKKSTISEKQNVMAAASKISSIKGTMQMTSGKHGSPIQQMDKMIDVLLAFKLDVKRIESMLRQKEGFSSSM